MATSGCERLKIGWRIDIPRKRAEQHRCCRPLPGARQMAMKAIRSEFEIEPIFRVKEQPVGALPMLVGDDDRLTKRHGSIECSFDIARLKQRQIAGYDTYERSAATGKRCRAIGRSAIYVWHVMRLLDEYRTMVFSHQGMRLVGTADGNAFQPSDFC